MNILRAPKSQHAVILHKIYIYLNSENIENGYLAVFYDFDILEKSKMLVCILERTKLIRNPYQIIVFSFFVLKNN